MRSAAAPRRRSPSCWRTTTAAASATWLACCRPAPAARRPWPSATRWAGCRAMTRGCAPCSARRCRGRSSTRRWCCAASRCSTTPRCSRRAFATAKAPTCAACCPARSCCRSARRWPCSGPARRRWPRRWPSCARRSPGRCSSSAACLARGCGACRRGPAAARARRRWRPSATSSRCSRAACAVRAFVAWSAPTAIPATARRRAWWCAPGLAWPTAAWGARRTAASCRRPRRWASRQWPRSARPVSASSRRRRRARRRRRRRGGWCRGPGAPPLAPQHQPQQGR